MGDITVRQTGDSVYIEDDVIEYTYTKGNRQYHLRAEINEDVLEELIIKLDKITKTILE